MELTLGICILYMGFVFLILGVWQPIKYIIIKYTYKLGKVEKETLFDFCCRTYSSMSWILKRKLNLRWFYNTKVFLIFTSLKFIILVLISTSIFIMYFTVKSSDYASYLDIIL